MWTDSFTAARSSPTWWRYSARSSISSTNSKRRRRLLMVKFKWITQSTWANTLCTSFNSLTTSSGKPLSIRLWCSWMLWGHRLRLQIFQRQLRSRIRGMLIKFSPERKSWFRTRIMSLIPSLSWESKFRVDLKTIWDREREYRREDSRSRKTLISIWPTSRGI